MRPPPPRTASTPLRHGASTRVDAAAESVVEGEPPGTARKTEDPSRGAHSEANISGSAGLASLALASGTGEDVAALGSKGPRPRFRLEAHVFRILMVALAVLLLVLWAWLALRLPAHSALTPGDGPEVNEVEPEKAAPGTYPGPEQQPEREGTGGDAATDVMPSSPEESAQAAPELPGTQPEATTIVVYVSGQVANPGVYDLPGNSRVNDLIAKAGGLSEGADSTAVNLAAPLVDAQHVHIPAPGEEVVPDASLPGNEDPAGNGTANSQQQASVDINAAGVEELQALPGIGPALGSAIVEWRESNGPFASVEDLLEVPGIGEVKLERLRDHATV
ncbi:helix-hairpin-helix domain-containing protein [Actinomycetaceae bacterium L2_0104]